MDGIYFTTDPLGECYPSLRDALAAAEPYRVGAMLAAGFHPTAAGWRITLANRIPDTGDRGGDGVWVQR